LIAKPQPVRPGGGVSYNIEAQWRGKLTDKPERVLAIIEHLESLGEVQMAEEIRALHVECEHLRAKLSHIRVSLHDLLGDLTR
jgi:hypothetical protein